MYALRVTKFNSFDKCISTGQPASRDAENTYKIARHSYVGMYRRNLCENNSHHSEKLYTANYSHRLVRLETCKLRIKTFAMKHC